LIISCPEGIFLRRKEGLTGGKFIKPDRLFLRFLLKNLRRKFQISTKVMFYRKMTQNNRASIQDISMKDAILILLFADSNNKIRGKFLLVKEAFLLTNKFFPDVFSQLSFYPSRYGPFSKILLNSIEQYSREGLVQIEQSINAYGGESYLYHLTVEGKTSGSSSFEKLSTPLKETIIKKRNEWDRLGYSGILRLVYSEYPEYTINSEIADKV